MVFDETRLKGSFIITPEKIVDSRGFFSRTFCEHEFAAAGLNNRFVQSSISFNRRKGTFRGMHMQLSPFEEDKLVTCTQGAILDYIVDLRETSLTYKQWISVELSAENRFMLYVPKSFAHGFLTLEDDTQVSYQMTEFYHAEAAYGFKWDDKAFGIELPYPINIISEKDLSFKEFSGLNK